MPQMMPLPWVFVFFSIFLCLYSAFLYSSLYTFLGLSGLKVFKCVDISLPW